MSRTVIVIGLLTAALAGCGEKPQNLTQRKADSPAWTGAQGGDSAPGWKAGDQTSWEAQMRTRSQGQNEYSRAEAQAQGR